MCVGWKRGGGGLEVRRVKKLSTNCDIGRGQPEFVIVMDANQDFEHVSRTPRYGAATLSQNKTSLFFHFLSLSQCS